ncbi:hypothetical protein O7635_10525 [Asanoa sp. WMMD1127]|uniref:hypothetical protein n=1 Tax=Asanoa sp. WMMD1127 TaxID=3016107 RepID=UPI002416E71D|nr:hypothetical protein [Asanoa sp. WMMD1127]MDG4822285.1 hypothetical protein [Asanoa sp. WMMD1127]
MPDHAPWPPPGGRHRTAGLSGPGRRYALIVLALAVTSSLPILAAIGPGAGSVGDAVAGDEFGGTTPFIPPPSPGPVVVIPIRPGVVEPPVPLATAPAPTGAAAPAREPVRQRVPRPARAAAGPPARAAERAHRPKCPAPKHRPTRPRVRPQRIVRDVEIPHRPRVRRPQVPRLAPPPVRPPRLRAPRPPVIRKLWDRPPAVLRPQWRPPGTP